MFNLGAIAIAIVNGASLSKHDQPNPSEYDEKSCPRRCSEAYYPLCGINENSDTKVFVNDCYMAMENCNQLAHQGACRFIIFCAAIFNPTIYHPLIRSYFVICHTLC